MSSAGEQGGMHSACTSYAFEGRYFYELVTTTITRNTDKQREISRSSSQLPGNRDAYRAHLNYICTSSAEDANMNESFLSLQHAQKLHEVQTSMKGAWKDNCKFYKCISPAVA